MADVHDFQATFNRYQPDVVITMSSKPPAFPEVAYEGEWLFRNFGGYDLLNMDAMGTIANEAIDALQLGKTVLIHCLHGHLIAQASSQLRSSTLDMTTPTSMTDSKSS